MLIMMPTVWVARSVDWNAENTMYLRIGFGILHVLAFIVLGYMYKLVQSNANEKKIKVPKKAQGFIPNPEGYDRELIRIFPRGPGFANNCCGLVRERRK
jgi:hypothetical protein